MTENRGFLKLLISSAIGAVCALAITLALMLGVAALILGMDQSETVEKAGVGISLFVGGAIGGFIAEKRSRGGAAFCGLITGALLLILLCVAGLIGYGSIDPVNSGGLIALCALLGAVVGALLGSGGRKKRKKKK